MLTMNDAQLTVLPERGLQRIDYIYQTKNFKLIIGLSEGIVVHELMYRKKIDMENDKMRLMDKITEIENEGKG